MPGQPQPVNPGALASKETNIMTMRTRGGKGTYRRTVQAAARDRRAAELHGQGWSYQRIADELRYASRGAAYDGVQRAFADLPAEGTDLARAIDLERIDRLIERAWAVMVRPHVTVSAGKVVRHVTGIAEDGTEQLGEAVADDGPVLTAIDRILALLARRAKIYGYDAPPAARIDVITTDAVESEIRRLEAELLMDRPDED